MLIRGISYGAAGPSLDFTGVEGNAALQLRAGDWLRFSVEGGPRRCLGIFTVLGPTTAEHHPCAGAAPAARGYQCGSCFARDDFRLVHNVHRDTGPGAALPPGLASYLSQEHWLYIATFADGSSKVGTASSRSKFSRLAEQGAVVACYVAAAQDGRIVRILEDAVSGGLSLTQRIRAAVKSAALLAPRPDHELSSINDRQAGAVREFLKSVNLAGFRIVDEEWKRPSFGAALCRPGTRYAYPQALESGAHGLQLVSLLGSCALVRLDASDADFLLDLGRLKGRTIRPGNFCSAAPALQERLF
ncbi:DUF2797 domain-containing protein [Paenarthrobacter sp. Z7-10]|nr:DUF2797 domain-containing protein [Paenarthrobacter sp. Z7-10]